MRRSSWITWIVAILAVMVLTGCGHTWGAERPADVVRLGYFPNLTHMAAIVGLEKGFFQQELGPSITLEARTFANGGLFMEAMSTGRIDIGYVGPGPALNIYLKYPAHQVLAGAVNGGAVLMAQSESGIQSLKDLDGKRIAIPVIGSTQDLMLRKALKEVGLAVKDNGGTVRTIAQAPADTAVLFLQKNVDAAATQEPWGVNLETKAGGRVLLDWDQFAWGKDSTNTVVVGSKAFTEANPELTRKLLKAHVRAVEFIRQHPDEARRLLIRHLENLTGKSLHDSELKAAMERCDVTWEVNEQVLREMAAISKEAGYAKTDKTDGFVNLSYLNDVLKE